MRKHLLWLSLSIGALLHAQAAKPCEAPAYFGICDPFVPGVIIQGEEPPSVSHRQVVTVTTWPGGPADKAGVCPGDLIVAVNGVSVSDQPLDAVIKRLAADSPVPAILGIKRGGQELEFRMPRVRSDGNPPR